MRCYVQSFSHSPFTYAFPFLLSDIPFQSFNPMTFLSTFYAFPLFTFFSSPPQSADFEFSFLGPSPLPFALSSSLSSSSAHFSLISQYPSSGVFPQECFQSYSRLLLLHRRKTVGLSYPKSMTLSKLFNYCPNSLCDLHTCTN